MGKAIIAIGIAVFGFVGLAIYASIQESKQWEEFRVSHSCQVVSHQKSQMQTGYGIMSNGKSGMITTTTPATTSWVCDDGVTYTR